MQPLSTKDIAIKKGRGNEFGKKSSTCRIPKLKRAEI